MPKGIPDPSPLSWGPPRGSICWYFWSQNRFQSFEKTIKMRSQTQVHCCVFFVLGIDFGIILRSFFSFRAIKNLRCSHRLHIKSSRFFSTPFVPPSGGPRGAKSRRIEFVWWFLAAIRILRVPQIGQLIRIVLQTTPPESTD